MTSNPAVSLTGKTIFITGAASGFGASCAQAAYAAGANVVLIDASKAGLALTSQSFSKSRALNIAVNLSDMTQIQDAIKLASEKFGGIDVVFANIGVETQTPTKSTFINERFLNSSYDINLLGIWNTVRACLPQIKATNGHIQITSSSYGFETGVSNAPHKIPRIAVELFNRELKKELTGTKASAGVFFPGWVLSPASAGVRSNYQVATELLNLVYYGKISNPAVSEIFDSSILNEIVLPETNAVIAKHPNRISFFSGCRNLLSDRVFNDSLRNQARSESMSAA